MEKLAKKEKRNKDNKLKILIYLLLISCLILMGILFYYYSMKPLELRKIDVRYIVDRKIGFDLNASALTFGIVPPGGASVRNISIGNVRDFPINVFILVDKSLANLIISEKNITIQPYGIGVVDFALRIPENYTLGNYTGSVVLKTYKA